MNSKLEAFADQIGKVPAEKIAEIADVSVEAVHAAEVEMGVRPAVFDDDEDEADDIDPEDEEAPRAVVASEPDADEDDLRELMALAKAAKAAGFRMSGGKVIAPRPKPVERLTIRLKRAHTYRGRTPQGKPVSVTLGRSIYRDEMARKVLEILGPKAGDMVEYL